MNNSSWVMIGSIIGFSIVLGFIITSNQDLKKEVGNQVGSVMKSTGKLVRHYRNMVDIVTAGDPEENIDQHSEEWNDIEKASAARAQQ